MVSQSKREERSSYWCLVVSSKVLIKKEKEGEHGTGIYQSKGAITLP